MLASAGNEEGVLPYMNESIYFCTKFTFDLKLCRVPYEEHVVHANVVASPNNVSSLN